MELSEFDKTLLTTRPFKYLDKEELTIIKAYCKTVSFSDKQLLFKQGKETAEMYIMLKGSAIVMAKILGKSAITLGILEQGNFFGEISLMQKSSCPATVIAQQEVQCLQLSSAYFDMLYLFFPEIRYKITKAIMDEIIWRLKKSHNEIVNHMQASQMNKISIYDRLIKSHGRQEATTYQASNLEASELGRLQAAYQLNENEMEELLQRADLIKTGNDCPLINQEEKHTSYYIILRGAVQISIIDNNKIAKIAVFSHPSIIGNISFLSDIGSLYSYITCERTLLLKISEEHLKKLEGENPKLWYKLFNYICISFIAIEEATDKLIIRFSSELHR